MKFEAITIKDIAKALNLSVSTVSKALRGSHEISEVTKKQVMAYAREHNYKPNPIAQSLKRGRSKSIGVIVCNIDNNFFSQAINGIESVARQKDYNVIITQSQESYEREIAECFLVDELIGNRLEDLLAGFTPDIGAELRIDCGVFA